MAAALYGSDALPPQPSADAAAVTPTPVGEAAYGNEAKAASPVVGELTVRGDRYLAEQLRVLTESTTYEALVVMANNSETDWALVRDKTRGVLSQHVREVEEKMQEHLRPGNFFDRAGEDSVESVLEDLLLKVSAEVTDEYKNTLIQAAKNESDVHEVLLDLVQHTEEVSNFTQEQKDAIYLEHLENDLAATTAGLTDQQLRRRRVYMNTWGALSLPHRSMFVRSGTFDWMEAVQEIVRAANTVFPSGGAVVSHHLAALEHDWSLTQRGKQNGDVLLRTLIFLEPLENQLQQKAAAAPASEDEAKLVSDLVALASAFSKRIDEETAIGLEVIGVIEEQAELVTCTDDLIAGVEHIAATEQEDEETAHAIVGMMVDIISDVDKLCTDMVEAVATGNMSLWNLDELSISEGSEQEQEDIFSQHEDLERRAAWQLFPSVIPKPAELFAGFEDEGEEADPDVNEEDDSDFEDGGNSGTVRDLFVSLGVPISFASRIEEDNINVDELMTMSNDELKKYIADKNIRSLLLEHFNAVNQRASTATPDVEEAKTLGETVYDICIQGGLDARTAERFELEEIGLSDLLDLSSAQLNMLVPRKAIRQRFSAWLQKNKAELKARKQQFAAKDEEQKRAATLRSQDDYKNWYNKNGSVGVRKSVFTDAQYQLLTSWGQGPPPRTQTLAKQVAFDNEETKLKLAEEIDVPEIKEDTTRWETLLRGAERGYSSVEELRSLDAAAKRRGGGYNVTEQLDLVSRVGLSFDPETAGLRRTITEKQASYADTRPDPHSRLCTLGSASDPCTIS